MQINRPKILVVDDELPIRLTVSALLEQEGYDVDCAATGDDAVDLIPHRHYDLVLTDLKLPGIDGLAVLAEVQKRSPDTVTLMMTGYGSVDSALEAVQLGAYEYLMKPVEPNLLKLAVRRSLERKRLSEVDTLYSVNRALANMLDPAQVAAEVCDAVQKVLGVEHACIAAFDADDLLPGCEPSLADILSNTAVISRLRDGAIVSTEDALMPEVRTWAERNRLKSVVLVPGIAAERLVCVLQADNGSQPYDFHASAARFLLGVATQAAMALQNALLVSALRNQNQELVQANEKLRELDKLKSQFLSVATHELRTPLSVILGYNAMLADSLAARLTSEEADTLRESVHACKRLIRLVNSMLDVTQIESGRMPMNFAPTDVREAVASVVALFRPEAERKDIKLFMHVAGRVPRAIIDNERIQQVIVNLVANSLKFTPSGGAVTVSVRYRPEQSVIEVAVADTGIGIASDQQACIFDPDSRRTKAVARREQEGAGLGLAISRRIIEAHDGKLTVRSDLGRGSTFTFTLPLRARVPAAQTAVSA